MARTVITSFIINSPTRVRVASAADRKTGDGDCLFIAGGKVYDNSAYDGKWHKFPEGTKFELCAIIDKTDTYCLLAKEKVQVKSVDEEGNETSKTRTQTNGVFLRRMSYNNLIKNVEIAEVAPIAEDDDFGAPMSDLSDEMFEAEQLKALTELVEGDETGLEDDDAADQAAAAK